jgi:hypothetical protein
MSFAAPSRLFTSTLVASWRACSFPLRLAALGVLSSVALLVVSQAHAAELPTGVYSLTPPGKPVATAMLTHPDVAGIVLRGQWQDVEPTEGRKGGTIGHFSTRSWHGRSTPAKPCSYASPLVAETHRPGSLRPGCKPSLSSIRTRIHAPMGKRSQCQSSGIQFFWRKRRRSLPL